MTLVEIDKEARRKLGQCVLQGDISIRVAWRFAREVRVMRSEKAKSVSQVEEVA